LRDSNFDVIEAESEKLAEELIAKEKFDLAVVNLRMEYADSGFRLCYHIKKKYPDMPTILCSAINSEIGMSFSMESEAERSWIKADSFLDKPIRFEQLLAEIESHLGCGAAAHH
jgi:DNA-binding response OmpR family regulator